MVPKTLMTVEEFEEIAEQLGPCELVRGEVIQLSPAGFSHSYITVKIAARLLTWAESTHKGRVLGGEAGLVVEPDTVRGADVAYYSFNRLPEKVSPRGFGRVPPNLVVEVIGKGHGWKEMQRKVGEYLAFGVDRVWVVDPDKQTLYVAQPDGPPVTLGVDDTMCDESILPGFSCPVRQFFE